MKDLNVTVWTVLMSDTMAVLYDLAERQAGYFTAAQALASGVSRRTLSGRVRSDDLERVSYGLYRLRRFPAHPHEDVVAACLWAGTDAVASHETALVVHDVSDAMPAVVHVTVPRPFRGQRAGVMIHRESLDPADREVRNSVPVTTLARTLRDVATTGDPSVVRQAVAEAIEKGSLARRHLRRLSREKPELATIMVDVLTED